MTLLVAEAARPALAGALGTDAATVGAASVTDALEADGEDVVLVDGNSVADPHGVVAAVREYAPDAAVVVAGANGVGDVSCATTDEQSVRAAVERARRIAAYRSSVSELYEACRDRALGQPDDAIRERRAAADRQFEDLPTDHESVAAALRTSADPTGDEDG